MASKRLLHFVFKIGDRAASAKFFRDILGMKVLRHEEFESGCLAACNGPYDGKWSKTMIGYGPEDTHFVCELTYNYGISDYVQGNDFLGIYIDSKEALERAKAAGLPVSQEGEHSVIQSPGGYKFILADKPQPRDKDPVQQVVLATNNLEQSINYWKDITEITLYSQTANTATLGFADSQAKLVFNNIGGAVEHAKAYGRLAIAVPEDEVPVLEEKQNKIGHRVLTPYIPLDTPGKATVKVVIVADPELHEVCFVGEEGFRALSQVDPEGDNLLNEAIENDKSDEWFAKKGGKQSA